MIIPFVNLQLQALSVSCKSLEAIRDVFLSGQYISGPNVSSFESRLATYLNVSHVITVGNGSDALVFILRSLNIKPGEEVICPGNSFIATAWAIRAVGATPIFCDVDEHLLLDLASLKKVISARTKAIIPVHLSGRVFDVCRLRAFLEAENLSIHIVEDAAQSYGAHDAQGNYTGSLGVAGAFSLHPLKNLSVAGDGGFITTNDDNVANLCRLYRNHGLKNRDEAVIWGFNSRLDEIHAAIGLVKLDYIVEWTSRYIQIAKMYDTLISANIIKPVIRTNFQDVYHNYIIQVDPSIRNQLRHELSQHGVETKIHYPIPLHMQECSRSLPPVSLPRVELAAQSMISLPIYPELTDEQVTYIADKLNFCYSQLLI